MAQHNHADDRDRAIESNFYLPGGITPPFDANGVERLWARLVNHRVERPQ
ncbi:MAG: hypothetical protein V5A43_07535 [Haloarculaceae archaeon]|nr:hypothetical protein [Halodesulfurarchaeum sp.]